MAEAQVVSKNWPNTQWNSNKQPMFVTAPRPNIVLPKIK